MISGRRIEKWIDENTDYELLDHHRELLATIPPGTGNWILMYARRDGFKQRVNEAIAALSDCNSTPK